MTGNRKKPIVDLGVPRSSRGGCTIQIKGLGPAGSMCACQKSGSHVLGTKCSASNGLETVSTNFEGDGKPITQQAF
jgi:hypothetical protein